MATVLIDGRAAIREETGGVERWAKELCRRLPGIDPALYRVASPGRLFAHRLGHLWEQAQLPVHARLAGVDALLCPANLAPLGFDRNVVVLHDVAPLRYPDDFSASYSRWQRFLLPRLATGALRVITPSAFSRDELVELCGADPSTVEVVHGGVPDLIGPGVDPEPAREALGLGRPYVLTVASRVKRKNLSALTPAAEALAREGIDLVAVGGGRPQFGAVDHAGGGVRDLGPLGDELLPGLYRGAEAFVLPSVYEGFGLPVCEAMAAGTPVVCSDRAALPEAAGGAALLVDPDDQSAIARALLEVCSDGSLRADLVQRGLKRVEGLTWQATAERVDGICRALAS
ncbi:MAG: glycosyltransferase family 1 protein [Actinomycetes bacterium]